MKVKFLALLAVSSLLVGACGSDRNDPASSGGGHDMGSMDTEGVVPGEAADGSQAEREILVTASDELSFDPSTIEVSAGEVVTFVIRNEGEIDHEFVLGDEVFQAMHEKDMEEGHHMGAVENGITVAPGQTKELTWKFTEAGSLEFGCHEPGHYEGGMVGTIEVG